MAQPQNPFQSPTANVNEPAQRGGGGTTGQFDIGQCFSDAWRLTWANFGVLLGAMLVGGIIYVVAGVTIIGLFVVVPVLGWGYIKLLLNAYDEKAEFGDLFAGFSRYGEALVAMLVLGVCYFGLYLVGNSLNFVGLAAKSSVLQGVGSLIGLVFNLVVLLRFYFSGFFIVDQQMTGIDSMKASWGATSQQKLNVFLLALLAGIVALVGFLALFIGAFASIPMSMMMWVSAYKQITGQART
jgi:uncharacterized membrane protein